MSRVNILVLGSAVALLLSVLNFVRRRRLREEYSWLWLLTSVTYLLLAVSPGFYRQVLQLTGATNAAMAFTFLGLYFLIFICIQFSVQLSRLVTRSKDLAQEVAILDAEIRELRSRLALQELTSPTAAEKGNGQGVRQTVLPLAASGEKLQRGGRKSGPDSRGSEGSLPSLIVPPLPREQDYAERSYD
jgi:hypothetical protein